MTRLPPRLVPLLVLPVLLALLWAFGYRELARDRQEALHDAETAAVLEARIFAENTLAKIKRIDELLFDLRDDWLDEPKKFSAVILARQALVADITFQIGIIDAKGNLAYSNLSPVSEPVYLGDREHFKTHITTREDRLFISKPIKGRVSGKWSIQFTRPILDGNVFKGVIVASVNPDTFTTFHANFNLGEHGLVSMVRASGETLARYPMNEDYYGRTVDVPDTDAPLTGTTTHVSRIDGIERIHGYARLPKYDLLFFVGKAMADLLEPHDNHKRTILGSLGAISLLLTAFAVMLFRMLTLREKALQHLRESQEQQRLLSLAIAQSNASVVMTDLGGTIIFVNDAFVRASGYARAEAVGQNPRILKSGFNKPEVYENLWSTITAGQAWRGELQNRRKNGELYWEYVTISPVQDEQGRITHYIGVKEDVTENKRMELELRHAKEEAEAASLAKSQFLATMSHEIRTPMNGILGMAQLLLMAEATKEERDEYARIILNSGNTLQALLNDILDLSKVEAGKLELVYAVFEPRQMIEEAAALFAEPARRKGLHITAHWNGLTDSRYLADPIRVRQMLANLLSNAIKFTEQGSIMVEASEVAHHDNAAELLFSVTDTGIGVPAEKRAQLFQPFTQLDGSSQRAHGGSGLGLSIVRNLAELMDGEAGVGSTQGQGSRFWFRIRVGFAAPDLDARRDNGAVARDLPLKSKIPLGSIMIVDDNEVNRQLLEMLLVKRGYRVSAQANGQLAVDALRAGPRPDLILMDCQMPVLDGFAATEEIRRREQAENLPRLPIIALTAGAYEENRQNCLAAGMDDFIAKPLDINKLFGMLDARMPAPPPAA